MIMANIGANEKQADVLAAPINLSAYRNNTKATPQEIMPTPSPAITGTKAVNLSPMHKPIIKEIRPPPRPRNEIVIAGFLLEIFFKKLLAKPIDIGEIKHNNVPIEKFIFSRSPKEITTQAANIKAMPIQRNLVIFSLNKKKAIKEVEIISKEPINEAFELDKNLNPNIKEIAAPL